MISKESFKSITMFKFFNLRDKSRKIASMQNFTLKGKKRFKLIISKLQNLYCCEFIQL